MSSVRDKWAQFMADNPGAWEDILNYLRSDLETKAKNDGCDCPVCGERAKWNRRSLSKKQSKALLNLYRASEPGVYVHITEFAESKGDGDEIAKTRYWGLATYEENTDDKKLHSGFWTLTEKGRRFIEGSVYIPKYVWVYRAQPMLYEGPEVKFAECLDEQFDIKKVLVPGPGGER